MRVMAGESPTIVADGVDRDAAEVAAWVRSFRQGGEERLRRDFPSKSAEPSFPRPDPEMSEVREALEYAAPKANGNTFGTYFSNALAVVFANALRRHGFDGVLPDAQGGFESRVQGARGLKKLDVNYSTPEMGLGLGLSIKTISSRDPKTKRYTKNYSRNDNELRAEAVDYHRRQPFAVLAAFLFLPADAADDASVSAEDSDDDRNVSSFGAAVKYFRYRTPRIDAHDEPDRFEAFYVALYEGDGTAMLWPVHDLTLGPPSARRPREGEYVSVDEAVGELIGIYERRNNPPFSWASE